MEFISSIIIGYLIGSFPTAYLTLRKVKNLDITKMGTGNVGAMNSFDVSGSALIGIFVFIIDFLKGFLTVLILNLLFHDSFVYGAIGTLFAIFAHCFNPWLKFKGGRGLSTAAGAAVLVFPFLLVVWIILWAIFYAMKREILISNIAANILSLFVTVSNPDLAVKYSSALIQDRNSLIFFTIATMLLIIIKHIEPLNELINNRKIITKK